MARVVLILSLLVFIAIWFARWWFWGRMQFRAKRMECEMSVAEMYQRLDLKPPRTGAPRDAASLGNALREAGLILLEQDGSSTAKKRRIGWWNLRILPVLVAVILVFSAVHAAIPRSLVVIVGCLIIVLHMLLRISGIGIELEAVKRAWHALDQRGGVRRMDEQETILRTARASVWNTILPW